MAQKRPRKILSRLLVLAVLVVAALLALALFRVGEVPEVRIETDRPGIGPRTAVTVSVAEPSRGLSAVVVELLQGDRVETLAEKTFEPRPFWAFWGPRVAGDVFAHEIGRQAQDWLREGEATIRVTADRAGTWLRRPDARVEELTLSVRLVPPAVHVRSTGVRVAQGGCEAVVYRVGQTAVRDGVEAGGWWFPGHPLPGGDERDRFALFAVPYDLDDVSRVRLRVADELGNEAGASFVNRFFPRPLKTDTIRISDSFMEKVVPEILSRTPELRDRGSLLDNYLAVNGELRAVNSEELVSHAERSRPEFLWSRPFLQMPNTQVMSAFADRRTYLYNGRKVDQQDHLGFDLASTRRAPVPSANDGVVVMARYFGIYGNAVLVDHGYGLMTLYGHLSAIEVAEGQEVGRGDTLGLTGETGLAGGDHLHFTVLLNGLPVSPVEWWDGHWIRDRIKSKLGAALPFES